MNIKNSQTRWAFVKTPLMILTTLFVLTACSSSNPEAPVLINGKHTADWSSKHGAAFLSNDNSCRECHGKDLSGGIVSPGDTLGAPGSPTCFSTDFNNVTCHGILGPFAHSSEFVHSHNIHALQYPQMTVEGPVGFKECVGCHGVDFEGLPFPQPDGSKPPSANCLTQCHSTIFTYLNGESAPHSGAPDWDETHFNTDQENAGTCARCHTNRESFRADVWGDLPFLFDAKAKPGCFNNTLCHADMANPHSGIADWTNPAVHGLRVKSSPENGLLYGFVNCSPCHKVDFSINCTNTCHLLPHAANWAGTGTFTHTTTSVDNVAACTVCHRNNNGLSVAGNPGCFNNTLCHDARNPHDANWSVPVNHGAAAKLPVPPLGVNELASFSSCQLCHGAGFNLNSCGSCHGPQPHPADWQGTGTYKHTNTDTSNVNVCFTCHAGGQNSPIPAPPAPAPGSLPGCFNNTLCHAVAGSPHLTGWNNPANHGVSAKAAPSQSSTIAGFTRCVICHQSDFSLNCTGCHTGTPHPATWKGAGIYNHQTTNGGNATVCAGCHAAGANSPLGPPTPPPAGTPAGCFNNTLCHGQGVSPHPENWTGAANHGTSAKAFNGYSSCADCHNATFNDNCTNLCHTPPHPGAWDVKAIYTHQSTHQTNAGECGKCHRTTGTGSAGVFMATGWPLSTPLAGAGCFANNLCHGQVGGTGPAHPIHMALPTPANNCTTCHQVTNGVLNFNSQYNARSGVASFNGTSDTCTNISCHGGQVTPVWLTGVIDVNTECGRCHTYGTTQFNGPFTSNHNRSDHRSRACTACHDTTRLTSTHFTTLNTAALNNPPATIKASLNYSGGNCATPGCHGSKNW